MVFDERVPRTGIPLETFGERRSAPEIGRMPRSTRQHVPDAGLKVGVASMVLVVEKAGFRDGRGGVRAGRAVNRASGCAGRADARELIAAGTVLSHFKNDVYLADPRGCPNGAPSEPWPETVAEKPRCRVPRAGCCARRGDEFCKAILHRRHRPELSGVLGVRGA